MKTRLLIKPDNSGFVDIDLYEDISIPLTFQVCDVKDLTKKNTNFSKSFEVPCTENNMQLLKGLNIAELSGNVQFGKKYPCRILHEDIDVINGIVKLEKVNKENNIPISYTLQVNSEVKSFIDDINDLTFEDIDWTGLVVDSSDMSPVNINNIWYGLDWYDQFDRGIGVALIDRINNIGNPVDYWRTKDLSPFIYANKILDKIITQAGYKWESIFFRHHFDGTWNDFNEWIHGSTDSSFNYPVREVRNVGKFDSRQFVIPSQIDPNNWEWSKVIPSNQIVDTYITRRNDDDDQKFISKSTSTEIYPVMSGSTISSTFFSMDSATNTEYKLPKVKADGSVDETAGVMNYVYTATVPGWYELSFDFDWKYELAQFRKGKYDNNVPAWDGADLLTAGQKIVIENPDQIFYKLGFVAQVCNPNDSIRKSYPLYSVENTGVGVKWFKGDDSNKNKIPMEPLNDYGNGLSFTSMEYEEYNNDEGTTMVSVNGYEFGRPVNRKLTVYLYAGDKVKLQSTGTWTDGYVEDGSNHAWEFNFRRSNTVNYYAPFRGSVWISSRPDHKLFDAKLIDKIGPYRTLDPSLFYDVKTKQTDFFNSLVKMFNLYIEDVSYKKIHEDGTDIFPNKTLRIEPRSVYYNLGMYNWQSNDPQEKYAKKIVDFSDFIDHSTISYKRPDDYLYTNLVFKMKNDSSDYFLKMYEDKTLRPLGELNIKAVYSSTESDANVDMIFANTTNGSSSCQHDPEFNVAIPCIFSLNDKGELNTGYTSAMRLLNKYSQTTRVPKVYYDSSLYLSGGNGTPILSVFDDVSVLDINSGEYRYGYNRLEFGTREYYLEKFTERNNPKISNTDLFNAFYLNEYSQITADDARILSCKCYIPSSVINGLKLSHSILIDGIIYYINKISNWVSENEPCDCEFLKFGPYAFYEPYIPNPTPNDFELQTIGVASTTDSNGNTTVNSTTNNYTIINQTTMGSSDNYTIGETGGDITLYKNGVSHSTAQLPTFSGSGRGFVPSSGGEPNKYLAADGTWKTVSGGGGGSYTLTQNRENIYLMSGGQVVSNVTVPDMVGATSGVSGKNGLVPAPTTADRTKFLKGDGTWDNDSYALDSTDGISVSLYRNGTLIDTVPIETFLGADAQNVGTPGLVPTTQVNDRFKFLRGDGTWQPAGGSGSYEIENDPHDSMVINLKDNGVVSSYANIPEYEACSQQYPGEYGAVHPAPQGAMTWYFGGDAQWRPIPTEAYVLQFTKHANFYTLDSGNYAGAVSALNAGKPVFAILNDEDSSQDGDKIVYGDAHWYADDTTIILHLHPNDSTELYLELYDDNSFDFYSNTVRNFGRLTVNGSSYQSSTPNTTLTLNDGTGISLNRTNATVTFNLKQATNQEIGGIKVSSTQASQIGSVAQGTVRPVQLDANGVAGVAIPEVTVISPLMDTGNGITCKAADIDDTPYRKGLGCLDYTKNYTQRAGCVTPMAAVDTDKNGEEAIKSWDKIDGAYIQPMGSFYFAAPKSEAEFYALPITMIRTKDGPVPVLLVSRDIYRMLGNYILNETPVVVGE